MNISLITADLAKLCKIEVIDIFDLQKQARRKHYDATYCRYKYYAMQNDKPIKITRQVYASIKQIPNNVRQDIVIKEATPETSDIVKQNPQLALWMFLNK